MSGAIRIRFVAIVVVGASLSLAALSPAISVAQNDPPVCVTARRLRAAGNPQAIRYERACEAARAAAARRAAPPRPAATPAPVAAAPAAAPMPAARGPAAPGTPAANDDWASNLPAVAAVEAAIAGSDSSDTAARHEAAFATLCDYVETRNGGMFKVMPPNVQAIWTDYNREQSRSHPSMPRSVSPAAARYFNSREFRDPCARPADPGPVLPLRPGSEGDARVHLALPSCQESGIASARTTLCSPR